MRDIEIRGKRKDNGGWVYGFYKRDHVTGIIYIITSGFQYEVIPETVGQWTGLLDKNGAKIFEGDILKYKEHYYAGKYHTHIGVVEWRENAACFICESRVIEGKPTRPDGTGLVALHFKYKAEVIGNIHDNPELLHAN